MLTAHHLWLNQRLKTHGNPGEVPSVNAYKRCFVAQYSINLVKLCEIGHNFCRQLGSTMNVHMRRFFALVAAILCLSVHKVVHAAIVPCLSIVLHSGYRHRRKRHAADLKTSMRV